MEIILDTDLIDAVIADERARMTHDLLHAASLEALTRSQARHDARVESAADSHTLACKAGCFWCCYFTVDVRAIEALQIVDYMAAHFTPEAQARVVREAEANVALLREVSDLERMQRNLKCPFLHVGRCTIYPVRPQTCRNYHATNATGCQQSVEQPENLDIDPEFAPLRYQIGGAHVDGFSLAMREAGFDEAIYEFNAALLAALANPAQALTNFNAKRTTFPAIEHRAAPLEFADDEDSG